MRHDSNILVTGASGHVGFNLVKMLFEAGYTNLRASVRDANDPAKTNKLYKLGIHDIVSLDIRDTDAFTAACSGIDVLFHVAATYRYYTGSSDADDDMIKDSVQGVRAAMLAAAQNGVSHVIQTSSMVTLPYATEGGGLPDETDWRTDLSVPYMRSKVEAEKLAWALADEHDIKLATILPGPILGPNFGKGTQSTDYIEGIMKGCMRMGTINTAFGVTDVRDVAQAHILAAEQGATGRYIVGTQEHITFPDIIRTMREIDPKTPKALMILPKATYWMLPFTDWLNNKMLGAPRLITRTFVNSIGSDQIAADSSKIRRELGWSQKYSLKECLRDTMAELKV